MNDGKAPEGLGVLFKLKASQMTGSAVQMTGGNERRGTVASEKHISLAIWDVSIQNMYDNMIVFLNIWFICFFVFGVGRSPFWFLIY